MYENYVPNKLRSGPEQFPVRKEGRMRAACSVFYRGWDLCVLADEQPTCKAYSIFSCVDNPLHFKDTLLPVNIPSEKEMNCLFGHLHISITITAPCICIIINIWVLASVLFGHSAQRVSYSRTCGPYFLVWAFMQLLNIYPWNLMTPIHLPKNVVCWHRRM